MEYGGKKKALICQNPSCKKNFTEPLKTLNLQQNSTEPYSACPYCLTRIIIEPALKTDEKTEGAPLQKEQTMIDQIEDKAKLAKNTDKAAACHYHLGFLSERSSKEQFPDECLICNDIVECMLKKMRE